MGARIKLVTIDMDRTAIEDSFQGLMQYLGKIKENKKLLELYNQGKIDYKTWAETEAGWMRGVRLDNLIDHITPLVYAPGLEEFCVYLQEKEIKRGIISAGADPLAKLILKELSLDFAIANEFQMERGVFTGKYAQKVDEVNKGKVLREVMQDYAVTRDQVMHIGDGVSDVSAWQEVDYPVGIYHWRKLEEVTPFIAPVYKDFFEILNNHDKIKEL